MRVYTFGTDHGWAATLDPFAVDSLGAINPTSRTDKRKLSMAADALVTDVLTCEDLLQIDIVGGAELKEQTPAMMASRSAFGSTSVKDRLRLGKAIRDVGYMTCLKVHSVTQHLPRSFDEFAREFEQALQPVVGPAGAPVSAEPIAMVASLKQEDLDYIARTIRAQGNPHSPIADLYEQASGSGAAPTAEDVYPLTAGTLCDDGTLRDGKQVKISVIKLSEDFVRDDHAQHVVQVVLSRLDA